MTDDYLISRRYDWNDVSPVVGAIEALSDADDTDPDAVPPLVETVDPESLNDLCASASTGRPVTVSFVHEGYDVIVRSDGFVGVNPA